MSNWIKNQLRVESYEFTVEAKTWISIICARVTPEKTKVTCTIMDVIPVNVGKIDIDEIIEVAAERIKSLFFPSLITDQCYEAGWKSKKGCSKLQVT